MELIVGKMRDKDGSMRGDRNDTAWETWIEKGAKNS